MARHKRSYRGIGCTKSHRVPHWFIDKIAYIGDSKVGSSDCYYTRNDKSYLTIAKWVHEGRYTVINTLFNLGISTQVYSPSHEVACVGFNPEEQKWYGWSHRAIYGFGIGSECKKGQCHYQPSDKEDFLESCLEWHSDSEYHATTVAKEVISAGGLTINKATKARKGVKVTWVYNNEVPNEKLRGTTQSRFVPYPEDFGRGEWVAETLEDAKQMAIDFADGVG